MITNFSDSLTLLDHAQEEALYTKLVAQLKKDFILANVWMDLPENVEPSKLKTLLHEKIYHLILEKFTEYLNLLYIIDVPEKAFKEVHMTDAVDVAEQVTFLVLEREFQKVWLKMKYS